MEQNVSFDLDRSIANWFNNIKVEPSITESDAEELRSHLLDQIDHLKEAGLDDEEAFLIATKRLRVSDDLVEEYRQSNNHLIQMRNSLLILGGVLVFFLLYYFIEAFSKILFIAVHSFSDANEYLAFNWYQRSIITWHFIILIFLVSIYLLENKTIKLIEKIKVKPKYSIFLLLLAIIFELVGMGAHSLVKTALKENYYLLDKFIHLNIYFGISFPILICFCFILIYYKYHKKSKN